MGCCTRGSSDRPRLESEIAGLWGILGGFLSDVFEGAGSGTALPVSNTSAVPLNNFK